MNSSKYSSTTLATWVFAIHRALSEQGLDADGIMQSVGFDFSSLTSTTQRVPKDKVNAIWKAAENATNDDAFCISIFPYINDPYLNALITGAQSSGSVQQLIKLLRRYYNVISSSSKIEFKLNQHVEFHILPIEPGGYVSPYTVDLVFGLASKYWSVLPVKDIQTLAIYMARSRPKNIAAYEKHFDCPIEFESGRNEIHYPSDALQAEIPSANPALTNHAEQYLAEQTDLVKDESVAASVERAIKQLIANGTPKLKDVAVVLNTSERSLQRNLQQAELSYTDLLNTVRVSLAKGYLTNSNEPIHNIAYRLGYTEPGNFTRFFKAQTGVTPNAFAQSCRK